MSSLRSGPAPTSFPTSLVVCVPVWHPCPTAGVLPAAAWTQAVAAAGVAAHAARGPAEKAAMHCAACLTIAALRPSCTRTPWAV